MKKLFIILFLLLNGCAYQFICGNGNTTAQPKTVTTNPELQSIFPISQGAASVSGATQTQNNDKGESK